MVRKHVGIIVILPLMLIFSLVILIGCDDWNSNSSPTTPEFKSNTAEVSDDIFLFDQQNLTVEYVGQLHNQMLVCYADQFETYQELQIAFNDGWLIDDMYVNFLADGPLAGYKLPTPGQIHLPNKEYFDGQDQESAIEILQQLILKQIADGSLTEEVGQMMLDVTDQVISHPTAVTGLADEMEELAQITNAGNIENDIVVVGIFVGSYQYWTGNWPGTDPPDTDDWIGIVLDVGGAVGGGAVAGPVGAALGGVAASAIWKIGN